MVTPKTIGESLYWAYSNFVMFCASFRTSEHREYQTIDYIIRSKTYRDLTSGKIQITSLFIDEKFKMESAGGCAYCGESEHLSVDHLVSRKKGGTDDPANLVMACRSCNSSKGSLDYLEWVVNVWDFPNPHMLRRYLKMAISYCVENELMSVSLQRVTSLDPPLPFAIAFLPAIVKQLREFGSEPMEEEQDPQPTLFDDLHE